MRLRYLYIGSSDTEVDTAAWLRIHGAQLVWRFRHFGADVAAIDLGAPPQVLIADHRPPGSVLPIYAVDDLDATLSLLRGQGWTLEVGPMGTPEGPACVLRPSDGGGAIALLRVDRPDAMQSSYADEANTHAVRQSTNRDE